MDGTDTARALSALHAINSDCDRNVWFRALCGAKDGGVSFEDADAWSATAPSYNPASMRETWKSIETGKPGYVNVGTLIDMAKERGWKDDGKRHYLTPEELAARRRKRQEDDQRAQADIAKEQAQAAAWADAIIKAGTHATVETPYLKRKDLQPVGELYEIDVQQAARILGYTPKFKGEPLQGRLLVVPIQRNGKVCSLELIDGDKRKHSLPGRETKTGGYWATTSPLPENVADIVIPEGCADTLTVKAAGASLGVSAMADTNLEKVAREMRRLYPGARITIPADLDKKTGRPNQHAIAAARAVNGLLAVPSFGPDRLPHQKDIDDLRAAFGIDAVRRCLAEALPVADDPRETEQAQHQTDKDDGLDAVIEWPEPREIKADLPPAPVFDAVALLPKTLADFVLDEADRMPCAPDFVASALLVSLGSVIGAKIALKPKRRDDWIVTPNLYGGIIAPPSEKKSPAANSVMRFLTLLTAKEAELQTEREKTYEAEMAAYEAQQGAVKAVMKKAASGAKPDSLKMEAAINDFQALQKPEKPQPRRFRTDDASVEKLGDLLVSNPHGILVFRDELTGLLASWDKEGHGQDRAFYLEGWNGTGSFNIDRIGRGEQYIKNVCLSVFGGIQPELLERYLSGIIIGMDNDGRFQRIQVLVYPDTVEWKWVDRYPVKGAREAVRDLFYRLAAFDPLQDGATPADDFVKLPHLCFDDAAQELFIEWSTELHRDLMVNETNPMLVQHLGKYEKLFCAIALILHLADVGIGPVGVDSALRAAAWCENLLGHARRVYGMVDAMKVNTAKTLSANLAKGKLQDGFTARDVMRKGWANIGTTTEAERELSILEEHGHVISYEVIHKHGRPTTQYKINPKLRGKS